MVSKDYEMRFAEAMRYVNSEGAHMSDYGLKSKCLREFKDRTLGVGRNESVKSLSELVRILTELNVVDSAEDGKEFVNELYGHSIEYQDGILFFEKIGDEPGKESCRITKTGYFFYGGCKN